METNNNMTYQEAIKELESIVAEIEKEDIPVDDLLVKVKRSSELIRFCQTKLTQTEEEVEQALQGLEKSSEPSEREKKDEENVQPDENLEENQQENDSEQE